MNAENLVEVGAGGVHLGGVKVIDDDAQRKVAEIVAFDFEFLDAFAQFADLGFLRVVHQNIRWRSIRDVEVAYKGALRVVEVAALRLDRLPCLAGILFLPLRDDVEVGLHFEKVLEDERKALGRGLLERQEP